MGRGFHLTIDEWFFHWFADEKKYKIATELFIKIFEICDQIVMRRNTRIAYKFYLMDEESGRWPPNQRHAVKIVKNLFLANSDKVYWVDDIVPFTQDINNKLPRKDIYLVEMCSQSINKILITSDKPLHKSLTDLFQTLSIRPFLVEDFIDKYLNNKI